MSFRNRYNQLSDSTKKDQKFVIKAKTQRVPEDEFYHEGYEDEQEYDSEYDGEDWDSKLVT